ncbi:GRAM domain-containing protein 2B-like isoform X2 [Micropterus dolomieu]|uniref:GRAM domain-containing protein 2B-like isoform X2 n=1 Tax=Micropterus dolomieu TaxID=147949 RepID=UPI001E8CFE9D|nr:GRAM domain-containing protein 2B-like isoform X2 [Micropterus dolomieu]
MSESVSVRVCLCVCTCSECMSWKCVFCIMSLKNRRFSLDSSVSPDGVGPLGGKTGSDRFSSKKSRKSLDDARLESHQLSHSLNSNISLREQSIAEETLQRSNGLINNNSFLKHNKTFHKLFQEIPEGENLIHSFTCALQKEVLYHGKLFVSENHVCFHSSVLLKDTKVVIPASSVRDVKKYNSALSMLSIQTVGEKYSFVSLRHREMCYKLLQTVSLHEQVESSTHPSSENEADHDLGSSYSSLEDCADHDLSRQQNIFLDNGFPQMSSEGPTRSNSTRQNSLIDEENRAESWLRRITENVAPLYFLREIRNLSVLFYIYMMLMTLLLLVAVYIGLRITALEEQLNSLGALTELSLHNGEYQET